MAELALDTDLLPYATREQRAAVLSLIGRHVPRDEWRSVTRMLGLTGEPVNLNRKTMLTNKRSWA